MIHFSEMFQITKKQPYQGFQDMINGVMKEGLKLTFALAGYSKDDLNLKFKDNTLYLSNKNKISEQENLQQGMIIRGIARRDFSLGFVISKDFDVSKTDAVIKNGLLKISIPKGENEKEKSIIIRGE